MNIPFNIGSQQKTKVMPTQKTFVLDFLEYFGKKKNDSLTILVKQ